MPTWGTGRAAPQAKRWRVSVLAVAFAVVLAACAGGPEPVELAQPPGDEAYRLGPGDQVRIVVFGEDTLSGEYRISGDGTLTLPLIGSVRGGGQTSDELRGSLEKELSEYLNAPNVSIEILDYRPFYIVGEVRNPGNYPYVDGMTVINAVAIAGGFTYRANTRAFYLERKGGTDGRVTVGQNTQIHPGDVVVVRERFF